MREVKKQFKKLRKIKPSNQWQDSQWDVLLDKISVGQPKRLTVLEKVSCFMSNPAIFRPVGNLVAIVLVVITGSWGMIASAENTTHGDLLYPVKKVIERVSLAMTVDDNARLEKQTELVSKRLFELNNLAIRLEYSDASNQNLDKTVDDLKKEIEAVHASLNQVKASGSADEILAVTSHVEEKTNQLTAKIAKTAEQLPVDVNLSMDELLQEAESLAEDTNKQLLQAIVSQDLSDGAISEQDIIKRLQARLNEVKAVYQTYSAEVDSWKNQYYVGDETMSDTIAKIDELQTKINTTFVAADSKFAEKDYVGILAAADNVEYLMSEVDSLINPPEVKGEEEAINATTTATEVSAPANVEQIDN